MNEEVLHAFADQLGTDTDAIMDRWEGRPDLILDDIFRVRDIDSGKARDLELFDVQRKVVHAYFYGDAGYLNAYKGRRIGYSFVVIACFLLEAMFYPNSFYPIVSSSLSQAKDRIADIQKLIDDAKISIPTTVTNKDEIVLWNGSGFMAYSSESDTSRGADSARAVLMDEMAFIENEERAHRAFGAFLVLGKNRKMVEISTPNTRNDLFMRHHEKGSPDGNDGIISIKQPTFYNAGDIDIEKSLFDQEIEPVRPEINLAQVEAERAADPEGFGQEYLCRPVIDSYRFFSPDSIQTAMKFATDPEYEMGLNATKVHGHRRVAGVDIGINRDDTAISIMDHNGDERYQRALFVVDDDLLRQAGVATPDRANANHIATLMNWLQHEMDIDMAIMDKGGPGETFKRIIDAKFGRKVVPFDFSAKDEVNDMMGDLNMALREERVTLVPEGRLRDELEAIVKEKRDHYAKPKFSGKKESKTGKDDTAIATALSAFPPKGIGEDTVPVGKKRTENYDPEPISPATRSSSKPRGDDFHVVGVNRIQRTTRSRKNKYRNRRHR